MKKWEFTPEGAKTFEGAMDLEGSELDKTMQTFSGDGEWKFLHGAKLFVDTDDIVIRGYDPFIGRSFSDLQRLNFEDVFVVQKTIANAIGATYKAEETPEDIQNKQEAVLKATEYLEERLKATEGYIGYRHEETDKI